MKRAASAVWAFIFMGLQGGKRGCAICCGKELVMRLEGFANALAGAKCWFAGGASLGEAQRRRGDER